jgi:penicillin-binding protein 1C
MGRAFKQNIKRGHIVSGGSTISMQVIRLYRKNASRTVWNKFYEMLLAVRLECAYSKEEIMNLYASHAPFGGNVVGLEAAAWRYYNRPAKMLSWGETAALAVLPNAPAMVFPGRNTAAYLRKRNRLLDKLHSTGIIDATTCSLAKFESLPSTPQPLPHLATHLLQKAIKDGFGGQRILSTVKVQVQQDVTDIATKYARYYASNYVNNVAVLVLDTKSGEILAYVGNVELTNKDNSQYVDNVVSLRSSGSILKPFLYAGMLNDGELLPQSLVPDIPTRIGGYAPENFENSFSGVVPADLALAHSLNIPAVRELQQYSPHKFHYLLKNVGFSSLNKPTAYYGLSIILGGSEVSLFETTSCYASMARSLLGYNERGKYSSDDYPNRIIPRMRELMPVLCGVPLMRCLP